MCGIVAVLARPSLRTPPDPGAIDTTFALAAQELTPLGGQIAGPATGSGANGADASAQLSGLYAATAALRALDASLRGVPGLTCLLGSPSGLDALERGTTQMDALAAGLEVALDAGHFKMGTSELEDFNAALVKFRDVIWALGRDRLEAARSVAALGTSLGLNVSSAGAGAPAPAAALGVLWAVHVALRSLDRLEVRGRDSAGLHLMLAGHGLDLGL